MARTGKCVFKNAPVTQQALVYFSHAAVVNCFTLVVMRVPAKIITEFFIRTALYDAVTRMAGIYRCGHMIGLRALQANTIYRLDTAEKTVLIRSIFCDDAGIEKPVRILNVVRSPVAVAAPKQRLTGARPVYRF